MRFNSAFVVSKVHNVVPITKWLPQYNVESALSDLIAGITVGLTLIPQSIAYAALAGLDPQFGLYASLCGGFLYACFGTVKDLNIAPTALISLLTYAYTKNLDSPQGAILLCFVTGVLQLLFGLLKLGFLVDFVSIPVVSAFTSAGALTIAASQVKSMLGLKFRAESFIGVIYQVGLNITSLKLGDSILSLISCISLISLREIKRWSTSPSFSNATSAKTGIWFVSVGRNALVVILSSCFAYFVQNDWLTLTNNVPDGLPSIELPFQLHNVWSQLGALGSGIFIVAMIAILSNMAIAKAFVNGNALRASHEMTTLGLCNIIGSFFGSYPVNASFSRAALNNASGAKTTFGGIYTGIMVILSLTFLTKYFVFIPKAALASVIFCAVIYMVDLKIFVVLWRTNRSDLIALLATFFWSLLDTIERGILVGVIVDLIRVVWWSSRPEVKELIISNDTVKYMQFALVGSLTYSSGEFLRQQIRKHCGSFEHNLPANDSQLTHKHKMIHIVLACDKLHRIDYTATKALGNLLDDLEEVPFNVAFLDLDKELRIKLETILDKTVTYVDQMHFADDLAQTYIKQDNANLSILTTPC